MGRSDLTTNRRGYAPRWLLIAFACLVLALQDCSVSAAATGGRVAWTTTSISRKSSSGGMTGWFKRTFSSSGRRAYQTMLREENERLERQIQQLQQELTQTKQQYSKQTQRYQKFKRQLKAKHDILTQEDLVHELKAQVQHLEETLREFEKIKKNLQSLLEQEEAKVAALQDRLAQATEDSEAARAKYEKDLADLQQQMERQAAQQLAALRQTLEQSHALQMKQAAERAQQAQERALKDAKEKWQKQAASALQKEKDAAAAMLKQMEATAAAALEQEKQASVAAVGQEKSKMRKLVKALAEREKKLLAQEGRLQKRSNNNKNKKESSDPPPSRPAATATQGPATSAGTVRHPVK